ncbi:hypothetical protein JOB18_006602 [Solea senegalensis]|uniref:Uncharacterized protein n=1 Tax=Solea senegalensis TaxID=28829 RepID=A0AAV6T4M7_SOLSE|nr:hypothetical protein JOB18_006602 [Solea senegalensis]
MQSVRVAPVGRSPSARTRGEEEEEWGSFWGPLLKKRRGEQSRAEERGEDRTREDRRGAGAPGVDLKFTLSSRHPYSGTAHHYAKMTGDAFPRTTDR